MTRRIVSSSCAAALFACAVGAAAQIAPQTPAAPQTPTQRPVQGQRGPREPQGPVGPLAQADAPKTVTGCVMREAEYRSIAGGGRGGALGTGAGVGNEFVLTKAMPGTSIAEAANRAAAAAAAGSTTETSTGTRERSTTSSSPTSTSGSAGATATGTSGSTRPGATAGANEPAAAAERIAREGVTASAAATGTTYSLTGDREKELEQYVGQRVEITGTFKDGYAPGAATTPKPSASTPSAGSLTEINVVSFRVVGGNCN